MFSIPRQIWIAFLPVFGVVLTIVLFIFQARLDLLSLSGKYVAINTILAALIALGSTTLLLVGVLLSTGFLSRVWRSFQVRITLHTLDRAVHRYSQPVQTTGIGEKEGSVVISLSTGVQDGVLVGDRFRLTNTATGETWGIMEAIEVQNISCVCQVSDRINVDFWEELELHTRRNPSPPSGVTITREFPEGFLEFMLTLVRNWRV